LDDDLSEYIKDYIDRFGDDHEIIFFLAGDHGMRYGEYDYRG
jgi:hypothetical protein